MGGPEGLGAADGDAVREAVGVGDGDARVFLGVEDLVDKVAVIEQVPGEGAEVGKRRRSIREDLSRPLLRAHGLPLRHLLFHQALPLICCNMARTVSKTDVTELAQVKEGDMLLTVEHRGGRAGGVEHRVHAHSNASAAEGDQEGVQVVAGEEDGRRIVLILRFVGLVIIVVVLVFLLVLVLLCVIRGDARQVVLLAHLLAAQRASALVLLGEPGGAAKDVEDMLAGEHEEPVGGLNGVVADGAVTARHFWLLIVLGGLCKRGCLWVQFLWREKDCGVFWNYYWSEKCFRAI